MIKNIAFQVLEQNSLIPSADSIIRRLKKVVQIIIKNWNNNSELMILNDKWAEYNKKCKRIK